MNWMIAFLSASMAASIFMAQTPSVAGAGLFVRAGDPVSCIQLDSVLASAKIKYLYMASASGHIDYVLPKDAKRARLVLARFAPAAEFDLECDGRVQKPLAFRWQVYKCKGRFGALTKPRFFDRTRFELLGSPPADDVEISGVWAAKRRINDHGRGVDAYQIRLFSGDSQWDLAAVPTRHSPQR